MKVYGQIENMRVSLEKVCECVGCQEIGGCNNIFCAIWKARRDLDGLEDEVDELTQSISAEKKASFRLGQMDMKESAAAALRHAADKTIGNTRIALLIAADVVKELEVLS